ncbi:hypothetical protein KAFR_0D01850 [Kazachstania africana CBS 2517]|uniref:Cytochrome c oxidase copper chaperone n=1 Tax=Kazachstania africana (strain ATCC 22294 / BCRC 22015 / CBS 2517 / CECT 1963 / NBRC 1671 / NRRL Y-8276) TaxID=1071382 RepID=H2ATY2_KAZAF|nr:hypothetical protein KAFR_0D01850 [Kazachstania africana CBS 2517]CCF57832.1 hypothetical protein KAFR_0D01850 [Kazachstania africana CBS 2517]
MVETTVSGQSQNNSEEKPKPCCVCLTEKEARDQCLLFKGADDGKCKEYIEKYRMCMKSFGFEI